MLKGVKTIVEEIRVLCNARGRDTILVSHPVLNSVRQGLTSTQFFFFFPRQPRCIEILDCPWTFSSINIIWCKTFFSHVKETKGKNKFFVVSWEKLDCEFSFSKRNEDHFQPIAVPSSCQQMESKLVCKVRRNVLSYSSLSHGGYHIVPGAYITFVSPR